MVYSFLAVAMLAGAPPALGGGIFPESDMKDTVRVALMRGIPGKWELEANFAVFLERLDEADNQGAEVFITPECWLDGYAAADRGSTRERLFEMAQNLSESPYLKRVAAEAKQRGMYICFGFTQNDNGRLYNAAGLWNSAGELIGVYHKTHLQTHDLQFDYGAALSAWPTGWGPVGMIICADRRWPESVRVLRLQGARLILNPTYGFRGDLNTAIMRTRAMENQCFIAFTHPEEGLVTGPKGQVVAQETGNSGVLVCDLDLTEAKLDNHLADRRPELYGALALGVRAAPAQPNPDGPTLRVAAAQMLSSFDVGANTQRIIELLEAAHAQGVRVTVFPEMALTGYTKAAAFADHLDWDAVNAGLARLQETCARLGVYAVVGAPTRDAAGMYCSAVTISPGGAIVDTYEKVYRAGEAWASAGRRVSTFTIDGVRCGTFICHDERYAPLVQLRALAGARVLFLLSCESGLEAVHKLNPYRAQVQARAVENGVFIVHANTPAAVDRTGLADTSHGESRIAGPEGNILNEGSTYGEQLVIADLPLDRARQGGLRAALTEGPLAEWMRAGVSLVDAENATDAESGH